MWTDGPSLSSDARRCRKSIEGAGACFAATFVSCAIVAASAAFPPAGAFTVGQVTLCSYVAVSTTAVDMLAPRTVDTALAALCASLILVGTFWYDFDAWMAENAHA